MEYYEIRCPCEKKHTVGDVEYDRCGTLLGAIGESGSGFFRCPTCGLVMVKHEESDLVFTIIGKRKINFNKTWRRIENE